VFAELQLAIGRTGTSEFWAINKSELTLTFVNGSVIRCLGLDSSTSGDVRGPEKLKSIVGMTSAWIEEATELGPVDYNQINLRLRGKTPSYKQIILTCNPVSIYSWVKKHFFDTPQNGKTTTHHSTYLQNPFIDLEYRDVLESLTDPALAMVYAKGLWGIVGNLVYGSFTNGAWKIPPTGPDEIFYGLDFGFAVPTALVRVDLWEATPYASELIYEPKLTTSALIAKMDALSVSKQAPIYGDNEDPAAIEEIAVAGYNIYPADKPQGSVKAGIKLVKQWDVHTCPENVNLNAEAASYKWLENKEGEIVQPERPVKWNDHALDALRYAIFTHLRDRVDESPKRFTYDAIADGGGGSMIRRLS
jgi:phage terminase large subunit